MSRIFRDTGTAWDNLTDNPGNIGTLQEVTTNGNTTTLGIFAGASGSLTAGRLLEVNGKSLLTDTSGNILYIGLPSISPNTSTLDVYGYTSLRNTVDTAANLGPLLYAQYSLNYNGIQLSGFANSIFAQDIYNVTASTTVASSTQSGTSLNINTYKFTSASTITFTQPAGTIRAASALTAYSQFQNTAVGTISHAAGIAILGIENIGGSGLTITNNYQLLINASNEFASTATVTNRWGIYQAGINDYNYFASKVLIGTDTPSAGLMTIAGDIYPGANNTYELGKTGNLWLAINTANYVNYGSTNSNYFATEGHKFNVDFISPVLTITSNKNVLIGTTANDGRKLVLAGEQEWITPTATGTHTTSGNHLPIWVNGVKYWLALLNPVIP